MYRFTAMLYILQCIPTPRRTARLFLGPTRDRLPTEATPDTDLAPPPPRPARPRGVSRGFPSNHDYRGLGRDRGAPRCHSHWLRAYPTLPGSPAKTTRVHRDYLFSFFFVYNPFFPIFFYSTLGYAALGALRPRTHSLTHGGSYFLPDVSPTRPNFNPPPNCWGCSNHR